MRAAVACLIAVAGFALTAFAKDDYQLGPDSMEQKDVPRGKVSKHTWKSNVFPDTVRDYWVYVPAQIDPKEPACVMVFQDGGSYVDPKGQFRVPTVFDNLIEKKDIPLLVGIFINPGKVPAKDGQKEINNRSFEYDTLSNQYAAFLEKEILPEVSKKHNLRQDAAGRGICGISSGGICALTVAWQRPDLFSKVLSHVGSFTNIRGGDVYPGLIRRTKGKPKPIRVFLQGGSQDLDNEYGHWPLANQQMALALRFAKYDYRFEYGDGGHNGKHGGAILPDSLRWLWREPVGSLKKHATSQPGNLRQGTAPRPGQSAAGVGHVPAIRRQGCRCFYSRHRCSPGSSRGAAFPGLQSQRGQGIFRRPRREALSAGPSGRRRPGQAHAELPSQPTSGGSPAHRHRRCRQSHFAPRIDRASISRIGSGRPGPWTSIGWRILSARLRGSRNFADFRQYFLGKRKSSVAKHQPSGRSLLATCSPPPVV